MPDPPNSLLAVVRSTRIVWAILLFTQFLYISTGSKIMPKIPPPGPAPSFTIAIAIAAACALCLVLLFRFRFVRRADEALQSNLTDAAAIARWRSRQMVTMVLAESVGLYGVVLLAIGAPLNQVAPFYATGIAAMLFVFPQNPASHS